MFVLSAGKDFRCKANPCNVPSKRQADFCRSHALRSRQAAKSRPASSSLPRTTYKLYCKNCKMDVEVHEFAGIFRKNGPGVNLASGRGVTTRGRWGYDQDGSSWQCSQGGCSMPTLTELEPEVWSQQEIGACQLGDVRRTRRLIHYARQMAVNPDADSSARRRNSIRHGSRYPGSSDKCCAG